MSLQRFLTRLIWLCMLPLLLLAALQVVDHVLDEQRVRERAADNLVRTVARTVDEQLRVRQAALQMLAESVAAHDPVRRTEMYAEAQAYVRHFGEAVRATEPDGEVLFDTRVPLDQAVPAAPLTPVAQAALQSGRPAFGELAPGASDVAPGCALANPVVVGGRVQRVLCLHLDRAFVQTLLDDLALRDGYSIRVRDGAGRLIAGRQAPGVAPDDRVASSRAVSAETAWTVELVARPWVRQGTTMRTALGLAAGVAVAVALGHLAGRWGGRRLAAALQSLTHAASPSEPMPAITEVAELRRVLDDAADASARAAAARERAEAQARLEREQAALAVQLREALLHGVFDGASDAIVTVDASQVIVLANRAAEQMFGHAKPLVGMPLEQLVPERFRARHRALVAGFGESGSTTRAMIGSADLLARRADGSEFPVDAAISRLQVDGRRLYTAILRDTTERRRAERRLQASQAKLQAALASMADALFIADERGHFVETNDAFARFHRCVDKAACARSAETLAAVIEMRTPDGAFVALHDWPSARALRGESATLVEYRLHRKDVGATWSGSFNYAPIRDGAGRIVGSVVTARDITAIKDAQAQLHDSHATLRRLLARQDHVAEAERRRIARELHDDLQQTLAAIVIESSLLRGNEAAPADALRQALARIDGLAAQAIQSTRRIVNDLRPQALEDLGLVPALESLTSHFARHAGVACEFEADDPVTGDLELPGEVATCLYRVTQEALNNVVKHAQAARVRVSLTRVEPDRLVLRVGDDGRGLPDDAGSKPGSFGLLGMRERVLAVGGRLRVLGPPGQGTTLEVEVPIAPAAPESAG